MALPKGYSFLTMRCLVWNAKPMHVKASSSNKLENENSIG